MASIGISDVVTASVYSEKIRMKKLMMMMKMIINPHRACARGLQLSLCLSLTHSLFHSGEGAIFRVEIYISIHSR